MYSIVSLGAYLKKWMECYIEQRHMNQPPTTYPVVRLRKDGDKNEVLQKAIDEFFTSKSIKKLAVPCHHIVLLSLFGELLPLGVGKGTKQGKFKFISNAIFFTYVFLFSISSVRHNGVYIKNTSVR